jgi:hypothetical protein
MHSYRGFLPPGLCHQTGSKQTGILNLITSLIFTKHLLHARHCARCWGNKQKGGKGIESSRPAWATESTPISKKKEEEEREEEQEEEEDKTHWPLSSYNPYGVNNYDRNLLKCFRPHQREQ